ncbi:MAG: hypothetical protein QOE63_365 [Acidimicrobiaceae bacterium]
MALSREVITDGLVAEMGRFEDLLRSLSPQEWATPSRCEGWTAGDVARHAIGSITDVVAGRFDGLGTPEVTQREVDERADKSAAEMADECAEAAKGAAGLLALFDDDAWDGPAPGGFDGSVGRGVEAFWYDFWLHGHDITASIGRAVDVGPSVISGVSHIGWELERAGWKGTFPAEADGQLQLILQATGRAPQTADGPPNLYADA